MSEVLIAYAGQQFQANRSEIDSAGILFNRVYLVCFILLVVLSIGFVLFPAKIPPEVFSIVASAFGLGGGDMLFWAWRRYAKAQSALDAFFDKAMQFQQREGAIAHRGTG